MTHVFSGRLMAIRRTNQVPSHIKQMPGKDLVRFELVFFKVPDFHVQAAQVVHDARFQQKRPGARGVYIGLKNSVQRDLSKEKAQSDIKC